MELRNYETIFILTPVLSKEQTEQAIKKFADFLLEKNAAIVYQEPIGLKSLAYQIQHKSTGIYHLIEFRATPDTVDALETAYRRDERVIRFLTFALDKHAVAYNARKRKEILTSQPETKQEITA